jgi:polyisoprenoid-binding protein YceI
MRKLVLATALLTLPLSAALAADSYTIDPAHTFPHFTINHLGFSTMHGRFDSTKGKITIDKANNTGSVDIVIDARSVDTAFKKRDEHLRSPDFLNVGEFPEITFKSTKVTLNGGTATVKGNLTLLGTSKPVTLDVNNMKCGVHPFSKKEVCGFNATAAIKRSDFGVKYGLPAIGDDMNLTFEVEAVKN